MAVQIVDRLAVDRDDWSAARPSGPGSRTAVPAVSPTTWTTSRTRHAGPWRRVRQLERSARGRPPRAGAGRARAARPRCCRPGDGRPGRGRCRRPGSRTRSRMQAVARDGERPGVGGGQRERRVRQRAVTAPSAKSRSRGASPADGRATRRGRAAPRRRPRRRARGGNRGPQTSLQSSATGRSSTSIATRSASA